MLTIRMQMVVQEDLDSDACDGVGDDVNDDEDAARDGDVQQR